MTLSATSTNHDTMSPIKADKGTAWLVYDGECPFCDAYVRHLRVSEAVGGLHLVNARQGGRVVEEVQARGFDLDRGMVVKLGGQFYHGAECMHVLASLSTRSGFFNRLNAALFASPTVSRWIYPLLRLGRGASLALWGRRRISPRRRPGRW